MKKGCLTFLALPVIIISLIISYTIIFPKKPATKKIKEEILLKEFNKIKSSDILNKKLIVLKYLQKNKTIILDSITTTNNNRDIFLSLKYYNIKKPHLPIAIFNELLNITPKENYELKITKEGKFSLINTITDYKNFLYLVHNLDEIDSLNNKFRNHTKTIIIENSYQYRLTIKSAFHDIDPNNFSPN